MDRITLKVDRRIHARLNLAKVGISATMGQQLTTSQAIEYLLEHWALTKDQRHLIVARPDGKIVGLARASAESA